jgi:hypothetical protein
MTPIANSDHSIAIGHCGFLTDDMRVADLVEVLEQLPSRHREHALVVDRGVKAFLLGLLRDRLPRASLRPQSPLQPQPRVRRIRREVSA